MLPPYSQSDSTRILSLYSGKNNHVWLGGSFNLAEGIDGKFSYVRVPGTADKATVEAITQDSSDNLWVVVWETDKSRVKRLRNGIWTDFRNSPELPNHRCRILFGDALGRVWLGFESGEVAVYENDRFHRYSVSDGLPPGRVLTIAGDRAGRVWVGGRGRAKPF
jgi:ligand-binding sensor domain-containing protein